MRTTGNGESHLGERTRVVIRIPLKFTHARYDNDCVAVDDTSLTHFVQESRHHGCIGWQRSAVLEEYVGALCTKITTGQSSKTSTKHAKHKREMRIVLDEEIGGGDVQSCAMRVLSVSDCMYYLASINESKVDITEARRKCDSSARPISKSGCVANTNELHISSDSLCKRSRSRSA